MEVFKKESGAQFETTDKFKIAKKDLPEEKTHFVIPAKSNFKFQRIYSRHVDKSTGLKCDQTIVLTGFYPSKDYPEQLRRIKYYDQETDNHFVFLTNNFQLSALTITKLYKCRWQIELFFSRISTQFCRS